MAAKYDIVLDSGTDYTLLLTFTDSAGEPLDFSGCSARMHIRAEPEARAVMAELSTENGRISISEDGAVLDFSGLFPAQMRYSGVYDILLTDLEGRVTRVLEGSFTARRGVTHD